MRHLYNENKQTSYLLMFVILINPIIDLVLSISRHYKLNFPSIGAMFRGGTIACALIYLVYMRFNNKKNKSYIENYDRFIILFLLVFFSYFSLYLFTRPYSFDLHSFTLELNELVRYMYFPLVFLAILEYTRVNNVSSTELIKYVQFSATIYAFLIIIPLVTNTGFDSYALDGLSGNVGWFHDANEIGLILGISINTYIYTFLYTEDRIRSIVSIVMTTLAIIILGTKGSLLLLALFFLILLIYLIRNFKFFCKLSIIGFFVFVGILTVLITPAGKNVLVLITDANPEDLIRILLSGRITFLNRVAVRFSSAELINKVMGLGPLVVNDKGLLVVDKLIEMDFFELLYRYGFISIILISSPFIITFRLFLLDLSSKKSIVEISFITLISVIVVLSFLIGHVLGAPSVGIYVIIVLVTSINLIKGEIRI